ncbi:hypothetical protein [Nonlabens antarcticus]|uniref:hypothetical protein n=1 Tax=Nonlabens antarcticus TaxID=392714 RepID=UPI001890D8F3|nr:hypothetical protein [Nonlabens antarcticus]
MKTLLKWILRLLLGILAVLGIIFITLKLTFNEEIPVGIPGKPADELALKMLESIKYKEFQEAKLISWTFRGKNKYRWEPQQGRVEVNWNDNRVMLDTQNPDSSSAFEDNKPLAGDKRSDAINYAVENFNNDSFWIVAPYKVMDPGTEREIIKEDAQEKLLVRYTNGGTTPGDVYVWKLDQNYRPQNFQMWVEILPFDGIEAKWDNWEMTDADFPLSMKKSIFGIEIPITDISVE